MPSQRLLAAIMFTDIVGYTALMGEDEQVALKLLRKNREIQKPIIDQFEGKWIKEIGDGILASFTTGSNAVKCAHAILRACMGETHLRLRIGIHQGEIIWENDDIYGDGVNIASRIQSIAPVDVIWVSEAVHVNLINKKEFTSRFVREETLKNVKDPIKLFQVEVTEKIDNGHQPIHRETTKNKTSDKSIAVLPFKNISNDPEQDYFSYGIAEEIINSLTHLKDLKVAGRTSSFQFKDSSLDLKTLGEKLGVRNVLEGSVRKQGKRLRVTAQLIDLNDGFHIWSEKFDRDMDDIFAIQDEIATSITEKLKITLLENERQAITRLATNNAEAYEVYLKGRFHLSRRGISILTGLRYLRKAITLDPNYALAHIAFAEANIISAAYDYISGEEILEEVKFSAEKAIKLESSSEAYCAMGLYCIMMREWENARDCFQKAIQLNFQYAQAHSWYGMLYLGFFQGRFAEAIEEGMFAIKLEPLSSIDHADLSWTLYMSGDFEKGLAYAQMGIELDANSFLSYRVAGLSLIALDRYAEAIEILERLLLISHNHQQGISALIYAYSKSGDVKKARQMYNELTSRSESEYRSGLHYGLAAAYLGDLDTAFNYLEKAYNDKDPQFNLLKFAPEVPEVVRNDDRFKKLLIKSGLLPSSVS